MGIKKNYFRSQSHNFYFGSMLFLGTLQPNLGFLFFTVLNVQNQLCYLGWNNKFLYGKTFNFLNQRYILLDMNNFIK